jgi:glycine cleavage system H protein
MSVPANLKYTEEHEWLRVEGDTAVVGITDHAQQQLGDVVFVELPEVGAELTKGATFGTVESVKAVSDLFAPLSGTVLEVNEALKDSPDAVNSDPYGKAWMIKLKLERAADAGSLLTAAAYEKILASA